MPSSAFATTRAGQPMAEKTVDVRNVSKHYKPSVVKGVFGRKGVHALAGVDMSVYRGEIFGLLGPNGAGKSTLVKILLGLVRPTTLEGDLLGAPVGRRQTMARVGYLPEQHRFPPYLTGRQIVEFFSALQGIDRRSRKSAAAALLDRVGMTDAADRRVNTYSKGMRQRVGLAQALASAPELIILDEPTDGVDPLARRDIRDVLIDARREGASVFVNSHLLGELELICDRVAILVNGVVARQGTIDELALGQERYEIELLHPIPPLELGEKLGITWDGPLPPPLPATIPSAPNAPDAQLSPASPSSAARTDATHVAPAFDPRTLSRLPAGAALSPFAARGKFLFDGQPVAISYDPFTRTIRLDSLDLAPATATLDAVRCAGQMIRRFNPVRPTLEDMFFTTINAPPSPNASR